MAAVEFALLAPMMVFVLFASVDLLDALGANRRAQNVASSLADVVARDTEVSSDEVSGIWAAANVLMFPDDGSNMDLRVTSIMIENANTARVVWSERHNNGFVTLSPGSTITLPSAMMTPGTSIIMADARFAYHPPLGFLFGDGIPLSHTSYRRSRLVDPIPRVS
ncbi:MAG: TadE/TadG family type IV pilus assembly protein [Hyphomonadaceae bacterium]|nr:TadE/TadG family type IV pilus assembly protein [Hyphomonadaceae bacterium]